MIRSTALFYAPGGDLIIGMVTKTFDNISVDDARDSMIKDVQSYRETGPLKGADMIVQAAEVSVEEWMFDETTVFQKKAS